MTKKKFPPGWDEARVKRFIAHCDEQEEDVELAEDEAARQHSGQTVMVVPSELVPAVRELIAKHSSR